MVILGGLEIVAGGYLVHRYHKKQNAKKKLIEEAQQRRHDTFPGAKPPVCYPQPHHAQHPHAQYPSQQNFSYAAHPPANHPQPPYSPPHRLYTEPLPHQPYDRPCPTQLPFTVPRRPLPRPQHSQSQPTAPPIIIQPLQRADSCATISRMPIANGRPQNAQLSPIPQSPMNSPYGNVAFAVSSPALGNNPTTPVYRPGQGQYAGRQAVDDNWQTYQQAPGHAHYAPSVSTALGEQRDDDPPPPYRP